MNEVLIVGMAKDTRDLAPWDDVDGEVWVMNEMMVAPKGGYDWVKRWDRGFQIHRRDDFTRADNHNYPDYWYWLQNNPGDNPIMMQQAYEDVPGSERYPLEEIVDGFGVGTRIFTCTLAYALALAVYWQVPKIYLYGFNAASDSEFRYQRDSIFFWRGFARARGAEIIIPEQSKLHRSHFRLYGYEGSHTILVDEFKERREMWLEAYRDLEGQAEALQELIASSDNEVEVAELSSTQNNVIQKMIWAMNAANENKFWADRDAPAYVQLFELRNREWGPELEKYKGQLHVITGKLPEKAELLKQTPSRNRGLKKKREKQVQKLAAQRGDMTEATVGVIARMEENRYWIKRSEMQVRTDDDEVQPQAPLQLRRAG